MHILHSGPYRYRFIPISPINFMFSACMSLCCLSTRLILCHIEWSLFAGGIRQDLCFVGVIDICLLEVIGITSMLFWQRWIFLSAYVVAIGKWSWWVSFVSPTEHIRFLQMDLSGRYCYHCKVLASDLRSRWSYTWISSCGPFGRSWCLQ